MRLSLKYSINPLFVAQVPLEKAHGNPRELNDGSEVNGLDNKPSCEFGIAPGARVPLGDAIGVMGASNSTCGSVSADVTVVQSTASLEKYTRAYGATVQL